MKLIYGSTATKHWYSDFREPSDIDAIYYNELVPKSSKQLDNKSVEEYPELKIIFDLNKDSTYVDPDILFAIKLSHSHWDVSFDKTINDIYFLKNKGINYNKEVYTALLPLWNRIHRKKNVNLNKKVEEFFKDYVIRKIDHEELHYIVKFYDEPMHMKIRKDLSNALCSEYLFEKLSKDDKIKAVVEELLVTAIERFNLHNLSTSVEKYKAVTRAYKLLCTSMTYGWFARFMILNYVEILHKKQIWKPHLTNVLKFIDKT